MHSRIKYFEKRTIHDINDNIYDIWDIFYYDSLGFKRSLVTFHDEETFNKYWSREDKYNSKNN